MVQFPNRTSHPELAVLKRKLGEGRTFPISKVLGFPSAQDNGELLQTVTAEIQARRDREQRFGSSLFSDPTWDILLALYRAHLQDRTLTPTELCIASTSAAGTALRWIAVLSKRGIIVEEHATRGALTSSSLLSELGASMMQDHFRSWWA